jgi:hypothetical protein
MIDTEAPPLTPAPPEPRPSRRPGWLRQTVAALVALALTTALVSYAGALTAPGQADWQDRSVGWVRDHGGNGLVNRIENWWYSRHAPAGGVPNPGVLPTWTTGGTGSAGQSPAPLGLVPGVPPFAGVGHWVAGRSDRSGEPALWTTLVRPDRAHTSVVAAVAWAPRSSTVAHLVPGTMEPVHGPVDTARVPTSAVPDLVATFNSGWKSRDILGGTYLAGTTLRPLVDGQASAVIDDTGALDVGVWGRDVTMGPHVQAVRQNLELVVDGGQVVDGLTSNRDGRWGSSLNQLQYTWRSGLGVDAGGNLVYVAGDGLTLQTLAIALHAAGAQRAMELDIHTGKVMFASWTPGSVDGAVHPQKLLPAMPSAPDRYLAPDQRDFFYLTLR